jgi:hypothetical protein
MANFSRLVCPTINKANNETWVLQPESPVGLRIHILLAVPLLYDKSTFELEYCVNSAIRLCVFQQGLQQQARS